MKRLATMMLIGLSATAFVAASDLLTVAERSVFTKTSLYADVIEFVSLAASRSDSIRVGELGTTAGGLSMPLVVVSEHGISTPSEARLLGLSSVLFIANIHAGEIEGKEALQMLLRDAVEGQLDDEIKNQALLLVPIFNADGNDKLGDNRGDDGPELAGIRYNDQNLDLNRDFIKLDTSEVRALVRAIQLWEPVLFVDMHTTNGSYHREPVTYTTGVNPNSSDRLKDYMWQKLFPAVGATLKNVWGWDSLPYGNFEDRTEPEKGWRNHAFEDRYSTNAIALRNVFTILDENYSHADFKTRVLSSHAFVRSIISYTHEHIGEMQKIVREESLRTREQFRRDGWVTEYEVGKLQDVTILSYEFEIEKIPEEDLDKYPPWLNGMLTKKTDRLAEYTVPYFSRAVPTATGSLPEAYVIPAAHKAAIENLEAQGVVLERLVEPIDVTAERFQINSLEPAPRPNQGRVPIDVEGEWMTEELTLEAGSVVVSLRQPLARLLPVLLEPHSADSLLRWGFFTSWVVPQWSRGFNPYPVLRLPVLPEGVVKRKLN